MTDTQGSGGSCEVYSRGDLVYVVSNAETPSGIRVATEPVFKLESGAPPTVVGERVLTALGAYRRLLQPTNLKEVSKAFLKAVGFKSWTSFVKGAAHVRIEQHGAEISVVPSIPDERGNFLHSPNQAVRSSQDPEEIGKHILRQFAVT